MRNYVREKIVAYFFDAFVILLFVVGFKHPLVHTFLSAIFVPILCFFPHWLIKDLEKSQQIESGRKQ